MRACGCKQCLLCCIVWCCMAYRAVDSEIVCCHALYCLFCCVGRHVACGAFKYCIFCSVMFCGILVLESVCGGFRIESRLVFCVLCDEVCVMCGEACVVCGTCVHESRYSHHGHSRPRHYSVHQMSLNCADNS